MKTSDTLNTVIQQLKPFLPDYLSEHGIDISRNFLCLSPEHKDSAPSCSICYKDPANPKVFCFGCGRVFDILDCCYIFEDKPRVGAAWIHETIKYLADKYNIEFKVGDLTEEQIYEIDTYRAYKVASSLLVNKNLSSIPVAEHAIQELNRRGWSEELLARESVGIVPDYVQFRKQLKSAGFGASFLDEIDLGRKDLFNPENLIFTWKDETGRPVGFTARNLLYEEQKKEADAHGEKCRYPKYNNQHTTGLKCNIYQKGKRLYGIDRAIKSIPPLYIFEGQGDVLTARQHGLENCVSLGGSSISNDHIFLLKSLGCNTIILILDSDPTGKEKTFQILNEKLSGHRDFRVQLAILPIGEDPDSFIRKEGIEKFRNLALFSAFEWRINQYLDTEDQSLICKEMIPYIVNESSPIERENMCKILSRRTGVSFKAISSELSILLNEKEYERSRERQDTINRTIYELQKSPIEAELIMREGCSSLMELSKKYHGDTLSVESNVEIITKLKEIEENKIDKYNGFELGPDLRTFQDALIGEWKQNVLFLIAAKENVGKCQSEDTLVLLNDGTYKTIKDIVKNKDKNIVKMTKDHKLTTGEVINWIDSGQLDCYRIEVSDGIYTEPSSTHPYYTPEGWKQVKDLKIGDKIAIAAKYDCFENIKSPLSDNDCILLAAFLSEGAITRTAGFSNTDQELIDIYQKCCRDIYPDVQFRQDKTVWYAHGPIGIKNNPVLEFLKKYKLLHTNSHSKFIPDEIFQCSKKRIGKFLGMFYACDGWVVEDQNTAEIGISLCNKNMITQIRSLLLRFGIRTKIMSSTATSQKDGKRFDKYTLSISNIEDMRKFYNNIRIPFSMKKNKLFNILKNARKIKSQYTDNFPPELWTIIEKKTNNKNLSFSELLKLIDPVRTILTYKEDGDRFSIIAGYQPNKYGGLNRKVLRTCGYLLNDSMLISLAEGDICFQEITKKDYIGKKQCYDLTVKDDHNFIANDMIVHNTGWCSKICYSLANYNNNIHVIYLSIDDTKEQIVPRIVSIAEGSKILTLNQVRNPNYWNELGKQYTRCRDILSRRETGYNKFIELIKQDKLIIKDSNDGRTLNYVELLISTYKEKYPNDDIVFVLDNFHKLSDFSNMKDERIRFKNLSVAIKEIATKWHICFFSTVEYTKLPPGIKPNNHNVSETIELAYDANVIMHLYSEVADIPDKYTICHRDYDWRGDLVVLPRVELNLGKNKVSDVKTTLYFDFWPASSDYQNIDPETVAREQEEMKRERKNNKKEDDVFGGVF